MNDENQKKLLDNKWETYKLLRPYYKREAVFVGTENDFSAFSDFCTRHQSFIVKPVSMGLGIGIYKVSLASSDIRPVFNDILAKDAKRVSAWNSTRRTVSEEGKRANELAQLQGCIVEELIEQDVAFENFHKESVNGLRLMAVPLLKIGVGNKVVDNAGAGGLVCGIDLSTGIINTNSMTETFMEMPCHPGTGIPFKGFQIPHWDELLLLTQELMSRLPQFGIIGWDFALTKNGWVVIEANYDPEFVVQQMLVGHGIKKELENIIGWKKL